MAKFIENSIRGIICGTLMAVVIAGVMHYGLGCDATFSNTAASLVGIILCGGFVGGE